MAITIQQLNTASNIITQLEDALSQLKQTVQFAIDQKVAGVPLDSAIITALQNQYTTLKAQLSTILGTLP